MNMDEQLAYFVGTVVVIIVASLTTYLKQRAQNEAIKRDIAVLTTSTESIKNEFATRRHRSEKWWELRVAAYQSVIEALSDLTHYYNSHYSTLIHQSELSEKYKAELEKFRDNSYHEVRKAADIGVFLFSDEVNKALRKFMDLRNEKHYSNFQYLDAYSAEAQNCLATIVGAAEKDLRLSD